MSRIYSKKIKKSQLKSFNLKKLLFSSTVTIGVFLPSNIVCKPLINPQLNEINQYFQKSFISKAVEKTGASVVTIDTQRYVRKRQFPRNSQLFLDPYFERFFGLDLPKDNQPVSYTHLTLPTKRIV